MRTRKRSRTKQRVLEKEVNNIIEKAERVIKDILEKKHANASKETLLQTPSSKSPAQPTHSPAHSQSSSSDHSGNCNQRLKPLKVPMFSGEKKHVNASKETLLQTPSSKSPAQPTHSPAHSQSSSSDH